MQKPEAIPALTGIRFVAAFMVLLGHGYPVLQFANSNVIGSVLGPLAGNAMTLFFVLSGFVIYLNYAESLRSAPDLKALRGFAAARAARLFPLYFVVLLLTLAVTDWTKLPTDAVAKLLYLPLLQGWVPGTGSLPLMHQIWEIGHAWSISAEWFFYALFPLVALCVGPSTSMRAIGLAIIAILAVQTVCLLTLGQMPLAIAKVAAPGLPTGQAVWWLGYYSPYFHVASFLCGCLFAVAFLKRGRPAGVSRAETSLAGAISWICVGILGWIMYQGFVPPVNSTGVIDGSVDPTPFVINRVGTILVSGALIYLVATYDITIGRVLSLKALVLGGELSYSLYLLHPFTLKLFVRPNLPELNFGTFWAWAFVMSAALLFTVVCSYGTYALIEVPGRRWLRAKLAQGSLTTQSVQARHRHAPAAAAGPRDLG